MKRIFKIFISTIIILTFLLLVACESNTILIEYKTSAKDVIQDFAEERQEGFSESEWLAVIDIVAIGKLAIDEAEDMLSIDEVVMTVKQEINDVTLGFVGEFYNLQEAFENGLLIKDDLESIANYNNDYSMSANIDPLSPKIEKGIKETKAYDLRNETYFDGTLILPEAKAGNITIYRYYGEYNGCYAIMIYASYYDYTEAEWTETVDGVDFNYSNGNRIYIWKEKTNEMDTIDFDLILGRMDYGVNTNNIETIIRSIAEWSELGEVTDLPELNDEFDEQFFENKALIVFALGRGTTGAQFEKVEVFGQDDELLVKVFDNDSGFMDAESNWIVVIEVQQNLISGVTNLRLETNFYSFSD